MLVLNGMVTVENKFGRMQKRTIMLYFVALSHGWREGLRKTVIIFSLLTG
jgi:hypothetical protein